MNQKKKKTLTPAKGVRKKNNKNNKKKKYKIQHKH